MKKFIYIAAGTVFAGSIMSSVYAIDAGYEDRARAKPTNQIAGTPPRSLNDVYAEDAYVRFARSLAQKNAGKTALIVDIERDKERGDSLVDEVLEKVGSAKLSEIAPEGFSIIFSTGVKKIVTFDENGAFHASHVSPPVSPMKSLRKQSLENDSTEEPAIAAVKLVRSESGSRWIAGN